MRPYLFPLLVTLELSLVVFAPAGAQQERTANPHGSLTDVDCAGCHTAEGWKPAKTTMDFDHDRETDFALAGKHRDASCSSCHLSSRFDEPKAAPSDCILCHVDVHQGYLSDRCTTCHTTTAFSDLPRIDIHAKTSFPLVGAHVQVSCESCHANDRSGAYTTLSSDCLSCHESAYTQPKAIDHAALGFPSDCRQCHSTLGWAHNTGLFDHVEASGGFQLLGAHMRIRCTSCHTGTALALVYATSDANDCISCHQGDYDQAHAGVFPTRCLDCHTNETWAGVTFDHAVATRGYELVGAHALIPCSACHDEGSGVTQFTPSDQNDCVTCHQADYDRAHESAAFPTTCLACHTNDTWAAAAFGDHDAQYFPIFSGAHRGRWTDCATCHSVPGNYQTFDCLTCHDHNQQSMDNKHSGERGYSYNSTACYTCHPRGRAD